MALLPFSAASSASQCLVIVGLRDKDERDVKALNISVKALRLNCARSCVSLRSKDFEQLGFWWKAGEGNAGTEHYVQTFYIFKRTSAILVAGRLYLLNLQKHQLREYPKHEYPKHGHKLQNALPVAKRHLLSVALLLSQSVPCLEENQKKGFKAF